MNEDVRLQDYKGMYEQLQRLYLPLQAKLREAETERDLAIAHDRQPYPTVDAYEKVCKALAETRKQSKKFIERLSGAQLTINRLRCENMDFKHGARAVQ